VDNGYLALDAARESHGALVIAIGKQKSLVRSSGRNIDTKY